MKPPPGRPLSRTERAELAAFLEARPRGLGSFESMDGFFTALLIGPNLIPPSRYFPILFGRIDDESEPAFTSQAEADRKFQLVFRHWNDIASAFEAAATRRPSLDPNHGSPPDAARWCRGFLAGVDLDRKGWRPCLKTLGREPLAPIERLARAELPGREIDLFARTAMIDALPDLLRLLHRATEPARIQRVAEIGPWQSDRTDVNTGPPRAGERDWEVGLVPLPTTFEKDPDARPVAIMIVSGTGRPILMKLEANLPPRPELVGELVARQVESAASKHGVPERIVVQEPAIARALQARAPLSGASVSIQGKLPMVTLVATDMIRDLIDPGGLPPGAAMSATWMGWGLSKALVAEMFRSAAALFRAAPWERYRDDHPIELVHPSGDRWAVSVLGAAGDQFGLGFFLEPEDLDRVLSDDDPRAAMGALRGTTLSLCFSHRDELRPASRKEVMRHGWEVASAGAYPELIVVNSPLGGVTEEQAEAMRCAIDAMARFAVAEQVRPTQRSGKRAVGGTPRRPRPRPGPRAKDWRDAETGIVIWG